METRFALEMSVNLIECPYCGEQRVLSAEDKDSYRCDCGRVSSRDWPTEEYGIIEIIVLYDGHEAEVIDSYFI